MATRIIIAGGRDFGDYLYMYAEMNKLLSEIEDDNIEIISGCARGADACGIRYAYAKKLPCKEFPADWNKYGKTAGFVRNEQMAKYAVEDGCTGILAAFWDLKSKGTENMINNAKKYGMKIHIFEYSSIDLELKNYLSQYEGKLIP